MKTIYEIFLQWNNKFFSSEILLLLHFGSCQNVEETELSKEKKLIMKTIYIYIYVKTEYEIFLQGNTHFFFFRKFCFSYILDLAKTVQALRILPQKFTRNFVIKDFWPLKNHVLVNILLCSSHFTEVN